MTTKLAAYWRSIRLFLVNGLLAAVVLMYGTAAAQTTPWVTLTVTPAQVELPTDAPATRQVLVVAQNATDRRAEGVRLSWLNDTSVEVKLDPDQATSIPPAGEVAWKLTVNSSGSDVISGAVHLRLDYHLAADDGSLVPRTTTATLTLEAAPAEQPADLVTLTTRPPLGAITDTRPATMTLLLSNTSSLTITVGPVQMRPAAPLTAGLSVTDSFILPPRTTFIVEARLEAVPPIQSGKRELFFEVPLTWQRHGVEQAGVAVAMAEVSIGVTGESDILTVLGLPSLLFLPGVLVVVSTGMIWGGLKALQGAASREPLLKPLSAEFWVVAVSISLAMTWIFPRLPLVGRDYLAGYGLADIAILWATSILLGILAGPLLVLMEPWGRAVAAWWHNRRHPTERDDALPTLAKLARRRLPARLEQVSWDERGELRTGFLIEPWDEQKEQLWVAPPADLAYIGQPTTRQAIDQALRTGDAWALFKEIGAAVKEGQARIDWRRDHVLRGPRLMRREQLRREAGRQDLVTTT